VADGALTLEMIQKAIDDIGRDFGKPHQPIFLMHTSTHQKVGKMGQVAYDERMEKQAREAAHHFFGAIAVPTPTWQEGAQFLMSGRLPTHRPPAPVPFEQSYASMERSDLSFWKRTLG
jgi:hypothetical protein